MGLASADERRRRPLISADLNQCAGVAALARSDVGRQWEISVRLLYASYADRRPVHYLIKNRVHGERYLQL